MVGIAIMVQFLKQAINLSIDQSYLYYA